MEQEERQRSPPRHYDSITNSVLTDRGFYSQGDLLPVGASSSWQRGDDDSCKLQAEQRARPWHEVAIEPPSLLSSAERLFPSLPWRKSSVCGSEGMKSKITVIPSGLQMLRNNLCEPSVFHQLVSGSILCCSSRCPKQTQPAARSSARWSLLCFTSRTRPAVWMHLPLHWLQTVSCTWANIGVNLTSGLLSGLLQFKPCHIQLLKEIWKLLNRQAGEERQSTFP